MSVSGLRNNRFLFIAIPGHWHTVQSSPVTSIRTSTTERRDRAPPRPVESGHAVNNQFAQSFFAVAVGVRPGLDLPSPQTGGPSARSHRLQGGGAHRAD